MKEKVKSMISLLLVLSLISSVLPSALVVQAAEVEQSQTTTDTNQNENTESSDTLAAESAITEPDSTDIKSSETEVLTNPVMEQEMTEAVVQRLVIVPMAKKNITFRL